MKTSLLASLVLAPAILAAALIAQTPPAAPAAAAAPAGPGLTLTTTAFADGGIIPMPYTQDAANPISPKLAWSYVPGGTVTFALIMHDPDVSITKTTEDVLHWLVFNIPATAQGLPENVAVAVQLPDGTVQGKNRAGINGYRGPGAPMAGPDHHYTLELFALDTKLALTADATRADVLKAMDGHILGKGVLVGRFHRTIAPPPAAPGTAPAPSK